MCCHQAYISLLRVVVNDQHDAIVIAPYIEDRIFIRNVISTIECLFQLDVVMCMAMPESGQSAS